MTVDLNACSNASPRSALRLGQVAPDFTARSTCGVVRLSDYRGQWLVLFSHPADFTPVCTSEFVAFAQAHDAFTRAGCALMALSVDSLFSHLAWIRAIRDAFDVVIKFPIIEDPTLEIGRAYGMVGPHDADASSVRTTYFLDPDGILRATTCYPANVGRSVDEILRLLVGLKRVAKGDVLAPEGWRPGANLLQAPTQEIDAILAAESPSAWFYRPIPDDNAP
jgi:peroxiredoxin (alkyl hydroperoxide reductase subunit C)